MGLGKFLKKGLKHVTGGVSRFTSGVVGGITDIGQSGAGALGYQTPSMKKDARKAEEEAVAAAKLADLRAEQGGMSAMAAELQRLRRKRGLYSTMLAGSYGSRAVGLGGSEGAAKPTLG